MSTPPIVQCVARGLALFCGTFAALNLLIGARHAALDANLWWIDLRAMPPAAAWVATAAVAWALIAYAAHPAMGDRRRAATIACLLFVAVAAIVNAATVWTLDARGLIDVGFAVPFSLAVAAGSIVMIAGVRSAGRSGPTTWRQPVAMLGAAGVCAIAFALGQMVCFGKTDYRRPADAAVVFGCRAYADGRASDALADRVTTAVRLYHDGLVGTLIFSGGPGDGDVHETESMRRLAIRLGVPDDAIELDTGGLNTQSTVANTAPMLAAGRAHRLLAVSHFYHLPRIKLAYQRAGVEVYTVPAEESYTLTQLPYNMAREVAALWVYYLRPLVHPAGRAAA